jgi:hypothetical protein
MTFHLRTLSARRYRVEGDLPPIHDPEFARRLSERRFRPLAPLEERGVGWVTADNFLDAGLTAEAFSRGPCAVFSLRIDKRRVSSRLLRAKFDLEMRGRRAAAAASGERRKGMGREERQEIRRGLTEELLKQTPPSSEAHAVLLYPREKVVLFQSLSRPVNDAFRAHFVDTFDVGLEPMTPWNRALELLGSKGGAEALAPLRRADFGTGSSREASPEGRIDSGAWRRVPAEHTEEASS